MYRKIQDDSKCPEEASDEEVNRILKEVKIIQEFDLVTRFTESPIMEESHPNIIITSPAPNTAEKKDNIPEASIPLSNEALRQKQIDRRRKFWIPSNCTFPTRKSIRKTRKALDSRSKLTNFPNQLLNATVNRLMREPKKCSSSLKNITDPIMSFYDDSLDLGLYNMAKTEMREFPNVEATLESPNLDSKTCEAESQNIGELRGEESLNSETCAAKSEILEHTSVETTPESPNFSFDLRASEAPSQKLEEPLRKDLGAWQAESKILEDRTFEATPGPSNLDLRACKEPQKKLLDSEDCEVKSTLEPLDLNPVLSTKEDI